MRHYEIVIMINPDQTNQVSTMLDRYSKMIQEKNGTIHRLEDWGLRPLAYPIKKLLKAHYVLMNIECEQDTIKALYENFRFSDMVLRHLILTRKDAVTDKSAVLKAKEKGKQAEGSEITKEQEVEE